MIKRLSSVEILADKFKTSSAATETQNIRANNETRKLTIKTIGEASLELVKNNNVYASAKMKNCSEE